MGYIIDYELSQEIPVSHKGGKEIWLHGMIT